MKNKKKRFPAILAATAVIISSVMSMSGSAAKPVRDSDGDGEIHLNDAINTAYYLAGRYNPTNVKSFDFDGNGIISAMDSQKIQHYLVHNISDSDLPDPSTETVQAAATTRTYMRHDCSSSNPASYSEYTLTVNPYDNTVSGANVTSYNLPRIIGDNEMEPDSESAVVNLSIGGSGFIVSNHVIATAAHCVYNWDSKTFINNTIRIVDSNNNEKIVSSKYIDVCKGYADSCAKINDYDHDYDYALIYVEEDLSKFGTLKMGAVLDEYVDNHGEVTVSGFPDTYPSEYEGQPYGLRFKAKGKITKKYDTNANIMYDADMAGGDSGGPVYVEEMFTLPTGERYEYKTVVAINVATSDIDNFGVRITPDLLSFYKDNPNIQY